MRRCSTLLLVLVAGCAANQRTTEKATRPEAEWPYELPAWALAVADVTTPDATTPTLALACCLYDAGNSADDLAAAAGLVGDEPAVLSEAAVATLLDRIKGDSNVMTIAFPRLMVYAGNPAWIRIEDQQQGGQRWCVKSERPAANGTVTLYYAIDSATRAEDGGWNMSKSWQMHGADDLKPGQGVLQRGGPAEADGSLLALLRLESIQLKPETAAK